MVLTLDRFILLTEAPMRRLVTPAPQAIFSICRKNGVARRRASLAEPEMVVWVALAETVAELYTLAAPGQIIWTGRKVLRQIPNRKM